MVEDSEADTLFVVRELMKNGYDVVHRRVDTAAAMQQALDEAEWDIVLSDHSMPQFSSTDALTLLKSRYADTPFIIVSGSIGEERAVQSMRAGASDYILKDNLRRLVPAIDRELRDAVDRRNRRQAEQALRVREEELRIARTIQQRLFPSAPPPIEGFDIAGASQPAEATGGDYYDFIPMANGRLALVVGDVSGHGLGPALLMAEARQCLRALALTSSGIGDMVERAAKLLRGDVGEDGFITMLLVELDLKAGTLNWVNAGHPAGLVMDVTGRIRNQLRADAPALSQFAEIDPPPPRQPMPLAPGDVVVLLTDGLLEAVSPEGEEFGEARLRQALKLTRAEPAERIVARLYAAVREFTGVTPQADDITAIVVRYMGPPSAAPDDAV